MSMPSSIKPGTKEHVVFCGLQRGWHNRFSAAAELGDSCLNTTVSVLRAKGVAIQQRRQKVRSRTGKLVSVNQYRVIRNPVR